MFLLKLFSTETLHKEIIKRETFDISGEVEATTIWRNVFYKVPELIDYLRRREIMLLKSTTLREKSSDFILGQISENRMWQRFDTVLSTNAEPQAKKEVKKLRPLESFLQGWKGRDKVSVAKSKKDADN